MLRSLTILIALCCSLSFAQGETLLRNICRVKGQEENVLRGYGLVVGLNGTGAANDGLTMRAMARAMELLGSPVGTTGRLDEAAVAELKSMKNAAPVIVTATVPATGARRGDKLDCVVSAINGKSLVGGQLAFATLQGPTITDRRVFALCSGSVQIDDAATPTAGMVHGGCQMEQDVFTPFYKDGYITLVLDKNHASFHVAAYIAQKIADDLNGYYGGVDPKTGAALTSDALGAVQAIDAANIRVRIPKAYESDPVSFTAQVLEKTIAEEDPEARVVINTKTGSIVISGDVRIGDVVVVHDSILVEAGAPAEFAPMYDDEEISPSLQALVDQLKQLNVPVKDVIEIIRAIERDGKLHGKLIIE